MTSTRRLPAFVLVRTLQDPAVQLANFGRRLGGQRDALPGFRRDLIETTDPAVLWTSGSATTRSSPRAVTPLTMSTAPSLRSRAPSWRSPTSTRLLTTTGSSYRSGPGPRLGVRQRRSHRLTAAAMAGLPVAGASRAMAELGGWRSLASRTRLPGDRVKHHELAVASALAPQLSPVSQFSQSGGVDAGGAQEFTLPQADDSKACGRRERRRSGVSLTVASHLLDP